MFVSNDGGIDGNCVIVSNDDSGDGVESSDVSSNTSNEAKAVSKNMKVVKIIVVLWLRK